MSPTLTLSAHPEPTAPWTPRSPGISSAPPTHNAAKTHPEFPPVHSSCVPTSEQAPPDGPEQNETKQEPSAPSSPWFPVLVPTPMEVRTWGWATFTPHLGSSLPRGLPASTLTPVIRSFTQQARDPCECKFYPGDPGQTPQRLPATLTVTFRSWLGSPRPSAAWPWLLPPPYLKLFSYCHLSLPHWPSGCFLTSPAQFQPRGVCPSNLRLKSRSPRYTPDAFECHVHREVSSDDCGTPEPA